MRCFFAIALSVFLAASASAADDAKQPPLKVFVLAGTSNMLGSNAKIENVPEDLRGPIDEVLMVYKGKWAPLEAGKNMVGNEASFGKAMAKHLGQPVGIVWIPVRYVDSPSIGPNINNTVKVWRDMGRPIEIAGMLLDVSFGDGLKEETAKAYGAGLVKWIEATRRDLGNDHLPIVMNRAIPPSSRTSFLHLVREAQVATKLPKFKVFDCDDVERGGDKVHFTTAGRVEIGKRFAAGMIELMAEQN